MCVCICVCVCVSWVSSDQHEAQRKEQSNFKRINESEKDIYEGE